MQLFLKKFVIEVNTTEVVKWTYLTTTHYSKPAVLCCSVDAPARAALLNMVPFNGYFGCPWCFVRGEHVEGSMRYIIKEQPEARTTYMVIRDMKLAEGYDNIINGFKGPSALMNLGGLDLVHSVLIGVVRQVTEIILSTSNSGQHFYVGRPSTLEDIDSRLLAIKPPLCVTRLPRPIRERGHWKASEWRQWILFYALPCLEGILHPDYWRHLCKLSEALHILLREELTLSEIAKAELLLESFYIQCK
ncbi:uncharacterized protein LOC144102597 [Amblyomma americanum]